jgi:hypothetical protein
VGLPTTSGLTYDPSGNTLTDGANTYTWDAESQMKTAAGVTYAYDGDGRRVSKSNGKLYWYGPGDEILGKPTVLTRPPTSTFSSAASASPHFLLAAPRPFTPKTSSAARASWSHRQE